MSNAEIYDILNDGYSSAGYARHNHKFTVGQKVRTRGDIGGFNLTIECIHNDHFCSVRGYGKVRHMNMAFLEPAGKGVSQ